MFIIKNEYYGEVAGIRDCRVFKAEGYTILNTEVDGVMNRHITLKGSLCGENLIHVTHKAYIMNENGATIDKVIGPELGALT